MSPKKFSRSEVISDYREGYRSRQVSLIGRREVLTGKAKFGIFGDGKELPQLAMAKVFRPGDFRSGYYRDQTLLFALGVLTYHEFFAQLYADPEISHEPASAGRQMNAHFATRLLGSDGDWLDSTKMVNSSADVSPTASQMPRLIGLAQASKLYRELGPSLDSSKFSEGGNEIAFGTIGNASSAEGLFWESVNAINVLQVPAVISIFDDEYGISVSNKDQFGKSLGELLSGFKKTEGEQYGYHIYSVRGWDYPGLLEVYASAEKKARQSHEPSVIHITELTQPQGHSTSGSHERYKSRSRLAWESEHDCLVVFRNWILENSFASEDEILALEQEDAAFVEEIRVEAWNSFKAPIIQEVDELERVFTENQVGVPNQLASKVRNAPNLVRKEILEAIDPFIRNESGSLSGPVQSALQAFRKRLISEGKERYASHLYSESAQSGHKITEVVPEYADVAPILNGFEILNKGFEGILKREPSVVAFGEDLGKIGGVNQGFAGLQEKFGEMRVSDTGIREATIIGQAIGLAMRGFRPIAEIQYLDYVLYALQLMSDDLATVQWRSVGGQKAPVIIRTRGHRLEGVWHSGSPMGALVNLLRGMHLIVPRNMVQAIGFYNTLIKSDEPGMVIEVLNGYRLKERLPENIYKIRFPLGVPEVIREGSDLSIITYGALCSIALQAADTLSEMGIDVEVIDVRTLLPFDIENRILRSIQKTNRVLFLDEDVPGGCTAYMMQQVLEGQGGYYWLDSVPRTLSAAPHRPPYGADGNYFSKPNKESIIETVYEMMRESNPARFRDLYGE